VVLKEGSVAWAVRASCALPGIFTPVERGDQLLVDGGTINNLPVSIVREMSADYVIAVDLLPPQDWHPRPQNLFEMWTLSFYTLLRVTHAEGEDADCLIVPDVGTYISMMDFSKTGELIEKGVEAAEAKMDQIKADLGL